MALKYRFNLKDIKLEDFKVYLLAMFKSILPRKKIRDLTDLEHFIQKKSAWVSQVTLYGYLKTRMGTKYVLHFDDEKFLGSINTAKWNIYSIALQDLTVISSPRKKYLILVPQLVGKRGQLPLLMPAYLRIISLHIAKLLAMRI